MGGQIPKHIAGPGKLRRYSPAGGFCLQLDGLVMEAVGELHVNDADLAEQSIGNHLPRLLDHLIAGIAVGNADDFVLFLLRSTSSRASSAVKQRGFSQITWSPASSAALVMAKWVLFGVVTETTSIPSGRCASSRNRVW